MRVVGDRGGRRDMRRSLMLFVLEIARETSFFFFPLFFWKSLIFLGLETARETFELALKPSLKKSFPDPQAGEVEVTLNRGNILVCF